MRGDVKQVILGFVAEGSTACQRLRKHLFWRRLWKAGATQNLLIGSGGARGAHSGPARDVSPVSGGTDAELTELQGLEGTVPSVDLTRLPRECG